MSKSRCFVVGAGLALLSVAPACGSAADPAQGTALQATTAAGCDALSTVPADLACTGLYSDAERQQVGADMLFFEPGFSLWSDGAEKRRFLALPPGARIDTAMADRWRFPVGTRTWKEFSIRVGGELRRAETRYMVKTGPTEWLAATYAWSPDQRSARRVRNGVDHVFGTEYSIPDETTCVRCHAGAPDSVLGFEAVLLAAPEARGATLATLAPMLTAPLDSAEFQVPGRPEERAALGYLHANCGIACHNTSPRADALGSAFPMRLELDASPRMLGPEARVESATVYRSGVDVRTLGYASPEFPPVASRRIAPGSPDASVLAYRMNSRGAGTAMPPIGTTIIDRGGVAQIRAWIAGLR